MRSSWRPAAAGLAALLALAWLAYAAVPVATLVARDHRSSAKDALPLYLGAHALAAGRDPNDPAVLQATFRELGIKAQVGGFFSYYPRTASVIAQPARALPFDAFVQPFRALLFVALVGAAVTGVLAGAAGPGRRDATRVLGLVAVAAATAAFTLSLRISAPIVRIAQPGPLVALLAGAGLFALATRRDVRAGVLLGLGACLKLFPGLVLLAALAERRWRVLGAAVGVVTALTLVAFALHPAIASRPGEVARFLFPDPTPEWDPRLLPLWRARVAVLPLTAVALGWAAWRRAPAAAAGALAMAGGAVILAGTRHPHEVVQLVPVLGWLAGGALRPGAHRLAGLVPLGVAGVGVLAGVTSPAGNAPTLGFLPFALAAWGACLGRLVRDAATRTP